jgi:integrase
MATIYKRGKYYWVAYRDRNGRRVQKSTKQTDGKAAAVIKRHYDAVEKSYHLTGTPLQKSISFAGYRHEYTQRRKGRVADSTLARERQALDSLPEPVKKKRLPAITAGDIEIWYSGLIQSRSQATANCLYRHVKAFFNAAVQDEYLTKSPCQIRKVREAVPVIRILTRQEADDILNFLPEHMADAVRAALYTGARAGELCRIKKEDADTDQQTVTIHSTADNPTKSRKARVIPIPGSSAEFFRNLKSKNPQSPYLLNNAGGKPWKMQWLSKNFTRWMQKKGMECSFHDLRRTYGAWLVMAGADLITVQKNLGHSDISVTVKHYADIAMKHRKEQVDRLPEL